MVRPSGPAAVEVPAACIALATMSGLKGVKSGSMGCRRLKERLARRFEMLGVTIGTEVNW